VWQSFCESAPAAAPSAEMADRGPSFPAPVKVLFAGSMETARAVSARVSSLPPNHGLPKVLRVGAPGSWCTPVRSQASTRLAQVTPRQDGSTRIWSASRGSRPRRRGCAAAERGADRAGEQGEQRDGGGGLGDDDVARLLPPAPRPSRVKSKVLVNDYDNDVLAACLRRACGVPVSESMSIRRSLVSAKIVGDVASRSRAIVLRVGFGKNDIAIIRVSSRRGLLCSCFSGTQNALFLSTSSRSTKFRHTHQLQSDHTTAGIIVHKYRSRMRLQADAHSFSACSAYSGALVWTVLYRLVFSVVSVTAGNVATCTAPGCRRFRGRCGHVQAARDHFSHLGMTGLTGLAPGVEVEAKKEPFDRARAVHLKSSDEDEGVEKLPSETLRVDGDSDPTALGARHKRNMLPCAGEIRHGETWNRTADWVLLINKGGTFGDARSSEDVKLMQALIDSATRRDIIIDTDKTLVYSACGSCGWRREDRHEVVEEPALLHTHHPTAPAIKVC